MQVFRLFKRSIRVALVSSLVIVPAPWAWAAQCDDPEASCVEPEAFLQDDSSVVFQAAQRAIRANHDEQAKAELAKLQGGDEAWRLIAQSANALVDGDMDGARAAAQQAVEKNGDSAWAHYQLGMVAYRQNDWGTASAESARAAELNGDIAYAHYYAGLAFQKQRQSAKAAEHLQAFLQRAPDAPERQAVMAIIRTLG